MQYQTVPQYVMVSCSVQFALSVAGKKEIKKITAYVEPKKSKDVAKKKNKTCTGYC